MAAAHRASALDPRFPLGLVRDAIDGLYDRAMVATADYRLHDEYAEALLSVVKQWDGVISSKEHCDPEAESRAWDAAREAACHPFVVTLVDNGPDHEGMEWRALISAPDIISAWADAERIGRENNSRAVETLCTRRCWHCLNAESKWDAKIRAAYAAHLGERLDAVIQTAPAFSTLRNGLAVGNHGEQARLSDSPDGRTADPHPNGHGQG